MDWIKRNNLNLISSTETVVIYAFNVLFGIMLVISLVNCDGITTVTPSETHETPTKQLDPLLRLIPQEPHIFVSFSGLDKSVIGYFCFRTLSGQVPISGSNLGDGEMRVVLPDHQGEIYIVFAEAEGYVSHPISYTIQLSGKNYFLVENSQITSNEVSGLKFQFKPIVTPTSY